MKYFTTAASSCPNIGIAPQREVLRTKVKVLNFLGSKTCFYCYEDNETALSEEHEDEKTTYSEKNLAAQHFNVFKDRSCPPSPNLLPCLQLPHLGHLYTAVERAKTQDRPQCSPWCTHFTNTLRLL